MQVGKNPFKKVRKPDLTKVGNWWAKDVIFWSFGSILYISVPFTFYLPRARELAKAWKKGKVIVGGPAAYIQPEYIEQFAKVGTKDDLQGIEPLVMHNPFATYTTRGCPNNCSFCSVDKVDGPYRELKNWTPRPMVCDNNFLSCSKKHFDKAIDRLKKLPYVDLQGIEARKVTKENSARLAELKKVRLIIGFDNVKYETKVHDAIKKLQAEGIKDIETYVLFGYKDTLEDTLYRLNKSLEWGVRPFPMRFQPLQGKHSLTKGTYVDPNWDLYTLRKIMAYYANLTRYSHIPFEEFQLTKEDNSQTGFGL